MREPLTMLKMNSRSLINKHLLDQLLAPIVTVFQIMTTVHKQKLLLDHLDTHLSLTNQLNQPLLLSWQEIQHLLKRHLRNITSSQRFKLPVLLWNHAQASNGRLPFSITSNPDFKMKLLFNAEYLRYGMKQRHTPIKKLVCDLLSENGAISNDL